MLVSVLDVLQALGIGGMQSCSEGLENMGVRGLAKGKRTVFPQTEHVNPGNVVMDVV